MLIALVIWLWVFGALPFATLLVEDSARKNGHVGKSGALALAIFWPILLPVFMLAVTVIRKEGVARSDSSEKREQHHGSLH